MATKVKKKEEAKFMLKCNKCGSHLFKRDDVVVKTMLARCMNGYYVESLDALGKEETLSTSRRETVEKGEWKCSDCDSTDIVEVGKGGDTGKEQEVTG